MNKIPCSFVAYSFFSFSFFFLISSLVSSANAGSSSRTLLPTPLSSLYSSESSVPWPNAAPALSTLRLEAFGHLSPALCLALGPSISHCLSLAVSLSLSICRPRSQWRSRCLCRCRCSCRACVFFNGFLANVLGAAVGPNSQQVPRALLN